eukprot:2926151-Rhodomonas_salina.1
MIRYSMSTDAGRLETRMRATSRLSAFSDDGGSSSSPSQKKWQATTDLHIASIEQGRRLQERGKGRDAEKDTVGKDVFANQKGVLRDLSNGTRSRTRVNFNVPSTAMHVMDWSGRESSDADGVRYGHFASARGRGGTEERESRPKEEEFPWWVAVVTEVSAEKQTGAGEGAGAGAEGVEQSFAWRDRVSEQQQASKHEQLATPNRITQRWNRRDGGRRRDGEEADTLSCDPTTFHGEDSRVREEGGTCQTRLEQHADANSTPRSSDSGSAGEEQTMPAHTDLQAGGAAHGAAGAGSMLHEEGVSREAEEGVRVHDASSSSHADSSSRMLAESAEEQKREGLSSTEQSSCESTLESEMQKCIAATTRVR